LDGDEQDGEGRAMAARRGRAKKYTVDFGDEDEVLEDVARALGEDPDNLEIEEEIGLTGFGAGTVYSITVQGGRDKEWQVVESEDAERALAIAVVTQDLEQEPEIFEKNFIEQHIDKDKLREELHSDALNSRTDDLSEMGSRHPDEFWDEWEREGLELPEHADPAENEDDEDFEQPEPEQSEIEELAEKQVDEQLRDPMQYLEEVYGDEAAAKAIEIAGIDVEEAAEYAVDTDGPAHFLARYDGNSHTTRAGLVYWRSN
jgi:hypothetical protein